MIERRHPNARIMCGSNECVARAETCTYDSELTVALLLQPIEAASNVDHALAHGVKRAADIGGDGLIGPLYLRRHADVVIRHAQSQDCYPEQIEHVTKTHVGNCVRVPVRQENDGAASSGGKPPRVHQIVLWIWRSHGRSKAKEIRRSALDLGCKLEIRNFARAENLYFTVFQPVVVGALIGVKRITVRNNPTVPLDEKLLGIVWDLSRTPAISARPIPGPLHRSEERR